jgi:CRISPR/Cas system-associated protein Cas10 (large subunit of type III CRISPR-Cas system)
MDPIPYVVGFLIVVIIAGIIIFQKEYPSQRRLKELRRKQEKIKRFNGMPLSSKENESERQSAA